jgi:hypothetical protein
LKGPRPEGPGLFFGRESKANAVRSIGHSLPLHLWERERCERSEAISGFWQKGFSTSADAKNKSLNKFIEKVIE